MRKFSEMSVMLLRMKFVVTFRHGLTSSPLICYTIFRRKTAKIPLFTPNIIQEDSVSRRRPRYSGRSMAMMRAAILRSFAETCGHITP